MFGDPRFSFDKSLSLSIFYVSWKIEENPVLWKFDFFSTFSAYAASNSAIILAARCWQKPIAKVEFNWKDDTGSNYLLDKPILMRKWVFSQLFLILFN